MIETGRQSTNRILLVRSILTNYNLNEKPRLFFFISFANSIIRLQIVCKIREQVFVNKTLNWMEGSFLNKIWLSNMSSPCTNFEVRKEKKKERRLHIDNRGVNLIMKGVSVSCQMINKVNEKSFFGNWEKKSLNEPVERPRFLPPLFMAERAFVVLSYFLCLLRDIIYSCPKIEI